MSITSKQKKFLRAKAHPLNVVVTIGAKGLTQPVKDEIELALEKHELIKLKLPAIDKPDKRAILDNLSDALNAHQIQLIGRVGILYRASKSAIISLPKP